MVILLIAMGALFALLFIVNSFLRAARGREKVGFFETLLAFLTLMLPLLGVVNNFASQQSLTLVNTAAFGLGIPVIVAGIITLLIERRKPGRPLSQRRGLLELGVGLLLVASTFVVPVASRSFAPSAVAARASTNAIATSDIVNVVQMTPVSQIALVPTRTPDAAVLQLSATPTRLPSLTPTPTNTSFVVASPTLGVENGTASVESTETSLCSAVVSKNLNLRSGPETNYQVLLTIPFSTTINVSARNEASNWWFVRYQTQTGWVSGDYLTLGTGCADLPVRGE
jgi:hypothetical protein